MTLRAQVEETIAAHRSGAIEVHKRSPRGESSISWEELSSFLKTHLEVEVSPFSGTGADIMVDMDKGIFHPMTEAGWNALEHIDALQPDGVFLKINSQDASHSIVNFKGLATSKHDEARISGDRARSGHEAKMGGYGTPRWE